MNNKTIKNMPEAPVKEKESKILTELTEKREENAKYFLTENHGGVAAIYPFPVHYKEDGQWKEIDNQLQEENTEESGYQNKKSSLKVKFAKKSKSKKLVTVQKKNHKISWCMEDDKKSDKKEKKDFTVYIPASESSNEDAFHDAAQDIQKQNQKFVKIPHLRSGGIYEDIKEGVDLEYLLESDRLKENIILKCKDAAKEAISFRINHKKLDLCLEKSGNIAFYEKGKKEEVIYSLGKPCMYDASGIYCGQVHYEAENVSNEETLLTIKADKEWLLAEERQYPVVIDPNMETSKNSKKIMDTFVREKQPNEGVSSTYGSFCVGNSDSYGKCRSFLKFTELPSLPQGAVLYDAILCIWQYTFSSYERKPFYVTAHEVKEDWTEGTLTWNNQKPHEAEILDYAKMDKVGSSIVPKQLHVTKLVRKWYNTGNNYGIMLKMYDEKIHSDATFLSSDHSTGGGITTDMYPSGMFYYRDANGLEDYYSYHDQSVGRAGIGYVNDFNGNLVFIHPDVTTSGTLMPASVSHVYNLSKRNEWLRVGYGWRLSAHKQLYSSGIKYFPYVYGDEDGKSHYFYKDTSDENKWKDEDGIGLIITQTSSSDNSSYMIMETKDKYQMIFRKDGFIAKEIDTSGNEIEYIYSPDAYGDRLVQIKDATGAVISLNYGENGELTNIVDDAGRVTYYAYENYNLRNITYPDNKRSWYQYSDHMLMYVKAPDNYEMDYTYQEDCKVMRVATITEWKSGGKVDSNKGQEIKISYKNGNMTVFEEPGIDGDLKNIADNKVYTYQFDSSGRPVCVVDQDGNGASYGYYKEGQKNNRLSEQGSTMKSIHNYMKNTRFEDRTTEDGLNHWAKYAMDTSQVNVVTNMGYIGSRSVKVTRPKTESSASGVQQIVELSPGTYTASAYMKAESMSGTGSLGLTIMGIKADGSTTTLAHSYGIKKATDSEIDGGWQRETVTFTLSSTYKRAAIIGSLANASGTAYMTCFQLEEGRQANKFNLMENGNFEIASSSSETVPDTFTGIETNSATLADGRIYGTSKYGQYSLQIHGEPDKRKGFWKEIPINGTEKDIFNVSGWAKGKGIPEKEFGMTVGFRYEDGTTKWENIPFNPYSEDWQFVSKTISPDDKQSDTNKKFTAILFHIFYGNNANNAYFDGIQIIRDDAQSYVYDDDGNLISAKSAAEKSGFSHDKNGNLSKMMDITGASFDYGYDYKQRLKSAASSEEITYRFEYSVNGNPLRTIANAERKHPAVTPGRSYYIREKVSGKYLNAAGNGTASGTAMQLQEFTNHNAQKWKVVDVGQGYISLIPMYAQSLALTVQSGKNVDGTVIQIATRDHSDAQKFKLKMSENSDYQILAKCSKDKRCLTNAANSTTNGAAVTLWGANDTYDRQKWYFEPADMGELTDFPEEGSVFSIRAYHSGQYLDTVLTNPSDGRILEQNYYSGSIKQCFFLKKENSSGDYSIHLAAEPDMVLARQGTYEGRQTITIHSYKSGDATQLFRFIKVGYAYAIWNPASNEGLGVMGNSWSAGGKLVTNGGTISEYAPNKRFILENRGNFIESSLSYTMDGRNVKKIKDARGYETTNTYDAKNRLLTSVKDAKGQVINYTYNTKNDQLTGVSANVGGTTISNSYSYDSGDRLSSIEHNGFTYGYEYDGFGNQTAVKLGSVTLEKNTYLPHNGPLESVTYANGDVITNKYDNNFRLIEQNHKHGTRTTDILRNTYDEYDNLCSQDDMINRVTYKYRYDLIDRLIAMERTDGQKLHLAYDDKNRIKSITHKVNDSGNTVKYLYGDISKNELPGLMYGIYVDGKRLSRINYDRMGRLQMKSLNLNSGKDYNIQYAYVPGNKECYTTTLAKEIKNGSQKLSYTYDEVGNIKTIRENGVLKATYNYDGIGRLIREDNKWLNKTICYAYDAGGNLLTKKEYNYVTGTVGTVRKTISYTYGNTAWKDQLTSYNGQNITYDAMGNPLSYRGMTMNWKKGRELMSLTKSGKTITYAYSPDGIRVGKTVKNGGVSEQIVTYYLNGNDILAMKTLHDMIHFIYDENGQLFAMDLNGTMYYYIYNIQNDVIGLLDRNGTQVVSYTYDSWGKQISMDDTSEEDVGTKNPFRYRGYYWDEETGLYYVNSRYYDAEVGRFINADDTELISSNPTALTDKNLYAYCDNNPVNRRDEEGEFWVTATKIAVGLLTQYAGDVVENITSGKKGLDILKPTSSVGDYVAAGVTSIIPGSGKLASISRAFVSETIKTAEKGIKGEKISVKSYLANVTTNAIKSVFVDTGIRKVDKFISSKTPSNSWDYKAKMMKKKSYKKMTRRTINKKMNRELRWNRRIRKGVSFVLNVFSNKLSIKR